MSVSAGPAVRPSTLAEGIFRREILPWGLIGLALGLVEGATAAVLVKQHFTGVAPAFGVNLAVALVSGAPAFSNVSSFVWANLAHGRARVQLMVAMQAAFALLVGCVSFAWSPWVSNERARSVSPRAQAASAEASTTSCACGARFTACCKSLSAKAH